MITLQIIPHSNTSENDREMPQSRVDSIKLCNQEEETREIRVNNKKHLQARTHLAKQPSFIIREDFFLFI